MQRTNHPIRPEELMAYLDGELPADRAVDAAAHLEQCAECRHVADSLRDVSQSLSMWEIEAAAAPITLSLEEELRNRPQTEEPAPVLLKPPSPRWLGVPKWAWGIGGVSALLIVGITMTTRPQAAVYQQDFKPTLRARRDASPAPASPMAEPTAKSEAASDTLSIRTGPMIARTAQLQLTSRDFDHLRERIDAILKKHSAYFGDLSINSPTGTGRTLTAKLQVPSAQLDPTIAELRPLGHVDQESQNAEEVTAAYNDLEARLANAHHTEQRIIDVLRERTGKLSDVLEAESQLSRVRGQIEQMDAEKRGLLKRVDYSTLNLIVSEDYKTPLQVSDGLGTQFHNAAVDGFRSMAGSLTGVALFMLSGGPVILLWIAILFFPARYVWRRFKKSTGRP